MKHVIAINGSPRKNANTATLLNRALEGAAAEGASVGLIHLVDLDYKGCISCFACHRKNTKWVGACASRDGLTPVLEQAMDSDVILLGSPIYLGDITSMMRGFLERFVYMNHTYDDPSMATFCGRKSGAFFYTMGAPESVAKQAYGRVFETNTNLLKRFHGRVEQLISADTTQFDDYSNYATSTVDLARKQQTKEQRFPADCEAAFQIGRSLAGSADDA